MTAPKVPSRLPICNMPRLYTHANNKGNATSEGTIDFQPRRHLASPAAKTVTSPSRVELCRGTKGTSTPLPRTCMPTSHLTLPGHKPLYDATQARLMLSDIYSFCFEICSANQVARMVDDRLGACMRCCYGCCGICSVDGFRLV